jgi:ribonuclease-3
MSLSDLFQDKTLLNKALKLAYKGRSADYERLEFLGDRVVGMVVAELLYTTFPKENEGDLAKRFVALTCEKALAEIAQTIGLPKLLKTNENELRHNSSVLSDVCEAVIAALYLDRGLEAVKTFMTPIWMPLILSNHQVPQDAKTSLQEWAQKTYKTLPVYTLINQEGPAHNPTFTVSVSIEKFSASGSGTSKKNAEQEAAQNLMEAIKNGH